MPSNDNSVDDQVSHSSAAYSDVCVIQVLNRLANTKRADLAKALRHIAASSLLTGPDTPALLCSGLVPKVLAILRSLPSGRPSRDAIAVCIAATAVLNNLSVSLATPTDRRAFSALLQADAEACCAVAHWGMAQPECAEKLSASDQPEWRQALAAVPEGADDIRHPFWTPFTLCLGFLGINLAGVTFEAHHLAWAALWPEAALEAVAAPSITERLLRAAAEHPCGRPPLESLINWGGAGHPAARVSHFPWCIPASCLDFAVHLDADISV
jgi:hypothetical protein